MAFKVKILSVLLFICLIDSLHSASHRRMKRDTEVKVDAEVDKNDPSKQPENTSEKETEGSKNPIDIEAILDKLFPDLKDPGSWFNNLVGKKD